MSDPSGQARGHFGRAQRGRSRHGFLPYCDTDAGSGRQERRPYRTLAPTREVSEHEGMLRPPKPRGDARWRTDGGRAHDGDDLISEVVPEVVLSFSLSGDVNQREMKY